MAVVQAPTKLHGTSGFQNTPHKAHPKISGLRLKTIYRSGEANSSDSKYPFSSHGSTSPLLRGRHMRGSPIVTSLGGVFEAFKSALMSTSATFRVRIRVSLRIQLTTPLLRKKKKIQALGIAAEAHCRLLTCVGSKSTSHRAASFCPACSCSTYLQSFQGLGHSHPPTTSNTRAHNHLSNKSLPIIRLKAQSCRAQRPTRHCRVESYNYPKFIE